MFFCERCPITVAAAATLSLCGTCSGFGMERPALRIWLGDDLHVPNATETRGNEVKAA